ncbi:MAG: DUF2062 domain-containing protein [Planctomycetaceae bacterium]
MVDQPANHTASPAHARRQPALDCAGTTVGMFIGLTPTGGIQMLLVLGFAYLVRRLFRFNQIAGLLAVYVSNPLTMIPIFWLDYRAGALFFSGAATPREFGEHLGISSDLSWFDQVRWLYDHVGAPFIVGSLVVAVIGAVLTYPLMRMLLSAFHLRRKSERTEALSKEPAVAIRD